MGIDNEKKEIEHTIDRARDGVGERIDELDRRLRTQLDIKTFATEHAPQIIAGGAILGFLAGFGFPKALRRAIIIGAPLAFVAMKLKKAHANGSGDVSPDYTI
ncbi:MAG TPA: hypothetical protein VF980_17455 [Thermoanaerobaculia bacterium]